MSKSKNRIFFPLAIFIAVTALMIAAVAETEQVSPAILLGCAGNIILAYLLFIKVPNKKIYRIITTIISIIAPFATMIILQYYTVDAFGEKGIYPKMIIVNALLWYGIHLSACGAFGSLKTGTKITVWFGFILGAVNYFVVLFRTTPIVPWDLLSIRTAISVAGNYEYQISWRFYWCTLSFLILIALISKSSGRKLGSKRRAITLSVGLAMLIATSVIIQDKDVKDKIGMDQTLFTMNVCYRNNGFLATFIGNLNLINIEKPDGYSDEKIKELEGKYAKDPVDITDTSKLPNIVVIMDEAFSDLKLHGDFNVSEDYMPCFHSLMKNCGGYLTVSVKGGNTANTEYEFLTGDSMAFMPAGSIPYQQYITEEMPSLASQLKEYGYKTTAIHPFFNTGWNRNNVYPFFGFDEFLSMKDFENPEYIRNYISDYSAMGKIYETLMEEEDTPHFIFEVTMQNHGGYSKNDGYQGYIKLTDLDEQETNTQTNATEKYLSLIKDSDNALYSFLKQLETCKKPTVVIMFGDHQPGDYISHVIDRIANTTINQDDPNSLLNDYTVPYIVWNNYGAVFEMPEISCPSFIGAEILNNIGIPLSGYQKLILDLEKEVKALSVMGAVTENGERITVEALKQMGLQSLEDYRIAQYNHIMGGSRRSKTLF